MSLARGCTVFWIAVVAILTLAATQAESRGTTSQSAFTRCGETHLSVTNNTPEYIDVVMFARYARVAPDASTVFWTDEPVDVDRVTRRRDGQTYHTSSTSYFNTEQRECTSLWATL